MDKLKLHLPIYDITLECSDSYPLDFRYPSSRQIKVLGGESFKNLLNNKILSGDNLGKYHLFVLEVDERDYNTIRSIGLLRNMPIALKLIDKFNELKNSDVSYGNFQSPDVGVDSVGYYGSKPLYVEDFFDYLKSDSRDLLISNILEDEKTK